jgi:para-aminobenzoate synthetase component 1
MEIQYLKKYYSRDEIYSLTNFIENTELTDAQNINSLYIKPRIQSHEYKNTVNSIKKHILRGDIYEVNYCQEYYSENQSVNPLEIYAKLKNISPTPFSCFFRLFDKYLISASPERFLKKIGSKVISQPMKGTINRGNSAKSDQHLKSKLKQDPKEIAENVMIVDLVRNDLSKSAAKESVKVEELCGIYTFEQVHQMVSTISAELEPQTDMIDAIKSTFPMGSMTGAPKVKAMELIEKYENTKRGMYSGAVGYFTPDNDFDFNVVIRSILYNSTRQYLSYMVGSAITAKSIPENEYNECLLKAKAINQVLN